VSAPDRVATQPPAGGEAQTHPLRAAWQTRDSGPWAQALAPDVVLHSPVIRSPFRGRRAVVELYEVLFDTLTDVEISDELLDGRTQAFFWSARVGRRRIEGADWLRHDAQGQIREITVLIRPLADIAIFAAAAGPLLAAKRGAGRSLVLRVLSLPLRAMLELADRAAARLIQRR
jgi:hypothetical protein